MRRRHFLGTVSGLTVASGAGASLFAGGPAMAATGTGAGTGAGTGNAPPTVTPADLRFHPRTLRPGSPRRAGLLADEVEALVPAEEPYMAPGPGRPHPSHPGFVLLAASDGVTVAHAARGHALRYARWDADAEEGAKAVELPREQWVAARTDTLYDMASVTKLFTSVVLVHLAERGEVDLAAPVTRYLPEFDASDPAKAAIVVEQLVTHTSGMKADMDLAPYPDNEARYEAVYAEPLEHPPGTHYTYSDLNLITVGRLMEVVTGRSLDRLVAEVVTGPLGLTDTGYNPPAAKLERIAATEWQPWTGRGMVRGSVHDEKAYYLGGVAGHAGIFSTAADMAVFGQMVLNGGSYGGHRILGEDWVRRMLTNQNAGLGADAARGLGWQLDQRFYMDAMTSPVSTGHTGYTGPSLVVDPLSRSLLVLMTNRVHPTREWGAVSDYRRAPARHLARAMPVRPATGRTAWFSGQRDAATATLRVPLERPAAREASLHFRLWYDTEETDVCTVEATTDAEGDAWRAVPLELRTEGGGTPRRWHVDGGLSGFSGRRWLRASGTLPAGVTAVRWRYVTDPGYQGRGVYVDDIRVDGRSADGARVDADGWTRSAD